MNEEMETKDAQAAGVKSKQEIIVLSVNQTKKVYAGSIREYSENKQYGSHWKARVSQGSRYLRGGCSFFRYNPTVAEDRERQRVNAWNWLCNASDDFGLTRETTVYKLTTYQCKYIAGFADGDSCLKVGTGTRVNVSLYQSSTHPSAPPPVLAKIKSWIGGSLIKVKRKKMKLPEWVLNWTALNCRPFLEIIVNFGILKKPQAAAILHLQDEMDKRQQGLVSIQACKQLATECAAKCKSLKKAYKDIPVQSSQLSVSYLAGFADAEGCVRYIADGNKATFSITQHGSPKMLAAIQKFYSSHRSVINFGYLRWEAQGSVQKILKSLRPFLIVKAEQADLIINRTTPLFKKRTRTELQEDSEREEKCRALKRLKTNV